MNDDLNILVRREPVMGGQWVARVARRTGKNVMTWCWDSPPCPTRTKALLAAMAYLEEYTPARLMRETMGRRMN